MEAVDIPDSNDKKAGISLPIPAARTLVASLTKRSNRDTPKVTPRDKTTPRDFEELSVLVRSQKKFSSYIKKNTDSILVESADQEEDHLSRAKKGRSINVHELMNSLADQIHLEPKVMAEAALRVHEEHDKEPLDDEKKGYEDLLKSNEEKYHELTREILLRMLLKELKEEDLSAPPLVDTHFGIIRKALQDKERLLFYWQLSLGVITLVGIGMTCWASYNQAHTGSSNCTGT